MTRPNCPDRQDLPSGGASALHRADTESKKDFLSGGSRETGFTEFWGPAGDLNVAGIKTIRAKTFKKKKNFFFYKKKKTPPPPPRGGEMYGMEPDRHGMVCCPFHSDSDPSMKLNDTYYYCFWLWEPTEMPSTPTSPPSCST